MHVPYLTDSSMRVKDVVKEFNAGGKLVQHKSGDVSTLHIVALLL